MRPFNLEETDRLLTTTRTVRKRLDLHRPVEGEVVQECLDIALHAPNASNRQEWRWIIITDPVLRSAISDIYKELLLPLLDEMREKRVQTGDADGLRISESTTYLAEHMAEVPVLVVPCFHYQPAPTTDLALTARMFGSIYPAVWNFQLALRSRGLGSALTTAHLLDPEPIQTLLGIPNSFTQTCLIPVAYTQGDFGPAKREPVANVIGWNGW